MDAKTKVTSSEAKTTVYKWILPLINPQISKEELVAGYKRWTEISDYEKVRFISSFFNLCEQQNLRLAYATAQLRV